MRGRRILAANLKRLRDERNFSQEDLAYDAGIDRTYVSALERCIYAASVDVLERIADALSVEIDVLLKK
jgi:transcriptional regulator with XRE-family HTH domain